jgi:protein-S-isoprenylcysteine O-methyltransferase Ste14
MFPYSQIILITWVIFWLYWIIAAFHSKRNASLNVGGFMGSRIILFLLLIILLRFQNIQNYSFKNHFLTGNIWVPVAGLVILFVGLLLAIWARLYLGQNWGMPMSLKKDPELVTSGPYHYIRHPIYTGILLAILGSFLSGNFFWLIIFAISGAYFIYSALFEEKLMMKQFPKTYPEYKNKTKMLIPFIF